MKNPPKSIPADEVLEAITAKPAARRAKSFRLTSEACRILAEESARMELEETKALELLLREIRELRKKGTKR